jgi:DNA-binding protein YbaB
MSDEARQLLDRIEAIDTANADNARKAEAYQRMAEELKNAVGRATSPDSAVTVVVGPGGAITSIDFTEQIRTMPPAALSASVLRAIAEAKAIAARTQAEVVRRGLGDTDLLDRVLDSDEQLFGDPRPQATPAISAPVAAPARGRPRRSEEDQRDVDEFENFDVFGDGAAR